MSKLDQYLIVRDSVCSLHLRPNFISHYNNTKFCDKIMHAMLNSNEKKKDSSNQISIFLKIFPS